jgi:hypothetical protein
MTTTIVCRHFPEEKTLACSLRTQQYADITLLPPALGPAAGEKNACQCSTHELLPFHMRERNSLCQNIIH